MTEIQLVLTKHAKEKMAMLGITKEQVKIAIQQGAKIKQAEGHLASCGYVKVAYKKLGEGIYKIKTVFVE